ncbi:MAG: hypothetical protein LF885_07325 (plasmid) [Rickettsia endosymbiont of Culicoides impunctatus]|nr:MAG: hypothetical protein LF885_07325 [Rickettsia endosymbiont of Culicoides impunctatus]
MRYNEIEKGLLSAISEDDQYKVSKQLQVKQWTHLYGQELLEFSLSRSLNFVKQVIIDDDCWKAVDNLEGVRLNRYKVGSKLLSKTTPGGEDNPFDNMQKYKVACWCCFEDEIRELFTEKRANIDEDFTTEMLLDSIYAGHGPLVTYWTHYITGYMDQFKAKLKLTGDNNDLHGFKSAVRGKHIEALEYFWNRLQSVLSSEEKDELLIYTATYYDIFIGSANSDMVDFAMHYLDKSKYHKLLMEDFEKNKHHSTLYNLISSYLFDRAEKLFKCLKQEDITDDDYSTAIYAALDSIVSVPNDQSFISAGYKMLSTMWYMEGFEAHKKSFTQALSYDLASADKIARLVELGRVSEILSEIVKSLNIEQVQNLQKSESWVYKILKVANLFSDDVMKHLIAIEQESINTLDNQEEMVILGANDSGGKP